MLLPIEDPMSLKDILSIKPGGEVIGAQVGLPPDTVSTCPVPPTANLVAVLPDD